MTEPAKSSKSWVLLAFLVGIALGAGAMRVYFTHTIGTWTPAHRFTVKLDEDLRLDPEQIRRVDLILLEQRKSMEDLRSVWKADVRLLAREGEDQIASLLTSLQMDAFMKRHDEIHGRMVRFLWITDADPTAIAVSPKP